MEKNHVTRSQLKKIWSNVPPDYYYNLNVWQRIWHGWKWLVIKQLLSDLVQPPKKILEIGCAAGYLTGKIAALYPQAEVIGIDVYDAAVKEAQMRHPQIKFLIANAMNLPCKNKSIDLMVSCETIEHVTDPKKMLSEIKRVLTDKGDVLIEMDSGSRLFHLIWYFWTLIGRGRVWKHSHLNSFTKNKLAKLIHQQGFKINKQINSHLGMAVSFLTSKIDNKIS